VTAALRLGISLPLDQLDAAFVAIVLSAVKRTACALKPPISHAAFTNP
jgi:hypothetical protein